ncbi:hypothetical protein BJI47_03615 [Rhodococcus sp. 1168]|nr:hypothetical protein BJI47_03615 [Rhodococcus sp. 1168]
MSSEHVVPTTHPTPELDDVDLTPDIRFLIRAGGGISTPATFQRTTGSRGIYRPRTITRSSKRQPNTS